MRTSRELSNRARYLNEDPYFTAKNQCLHNRLASTGRARAQCQKVVLGHRDLPDGIEKNHAALGYHFLCAPIPQSFINEPEVVSVYSVNCYSCFDYIILNQVLAELIRSLNIQYNDGRYNCYPGHGEDLNEGRA